MYPFFKKFSVQERIMIKIILNHLTAGKRVRLLSGHQDQFAAGDTIESAAMVISASPSTI